MREKTDFTRYCRSTQADLDYIPINARISYEAVQEAIQQVKSLLKQKEFKSILSDKDKKYIMEICQDKFSACKTYGELTEALENITATNEEEVKAYLGTESWSKIMELGGENGEQRLNVFENAINTWNIAIRKKLGQSIGITI